VFVNSIFFNELTSSQGKWPHPKEIGWFILLGILGIFVNQLFFILAVAFSGSILPSVMQVCVQKEPNETLTNLN
jgi:hypothetical protein